MAIETQVYRTISQSINNGTDIRYYLIEIDGDMDNALVERVVAYARGRMNDAGFPVTENIHVSTNSSQNDAPEDMAYDVSFINNNGGRIVIVNVKLCGDGTFIDYGFDIEY